MQRLSLNDYRLGQILEALFAANRKQVCGAVALKALEVYAISTPWLHQDTTTIALYGTYEGEAPPDAQPTQDEEVPVPPRPTYGHSKDGRDDLKQVLLSLGVSGDGGLPLRVGIRDGNTSDSLETPLAIEACLTLGLAGVHGMVADSQGYSQRTRGLCLEKGVGVVTLVPRTCAVRQELEVWGQHQSTLPLLVEKPGRPQDEAPRHWRGQSVTRPVAVEYSDGRVAQEALRFVVVHSSQLAQQQSHTYAVAQAKEAEGLTAHVRRVEARRFACVADAEAAIAEYEGRGQGRRGRRPRPWRYHPVHYRVVTDTQRKRRTHRGRPAKTEALQLETAYRLVTAVETLSRAEEENGWTVLATTVSQERCSDAEMLSAYQEQHTSVEPGFRWIKNPAAIRPVWLEKPERIAALAMLTVMGLLVYAVIQRQVRLYLQTHEQQVPGHKGETATPTAAVVLAFFEPVAVVHLLIDTTEVQQLYGLQAHHLLVCDALGLDHTWDEAPRVHKHTEGARTP